MNNQSWYSSFAYWEEIQDEMKPAIEALRKALKKVPRDLPWDEVRIVLDMDGLGHSIHLIYTPPEDTFTKIFNDEWGS